MRHHVLSALALLLLAAGLRAADAPAPHWIWSAATASNGQQVYFRKAFTVDGKAAGAKLLVTGDNHATAWINGQQVAKTDDWASPAAADVTALLKPGTNVIAIEGRNDDGIAAVVARLSIKDAAGKSHDVVSDASWKQSEGKADGWQNAAFDDAAWKPSFDIGALGKDPWGNVFGGGKNSPGAVTPPESLALLPGFKAELVYVVPKAEQGSWVSLTCDDKGRLIAADQGGAGIYRITPSAIGADAETTKVEKIDLPISSAHGLLYAFDSLYVMINGKVGENSSGLYRLQDTDGDDKFDKITKLRNFDGSGEHGPHAIVLSPDKKSLYVCCGNHTKIPDHYDTYLVPKNWAEDILLPRHWDPNGHARGIMAPGGYISHTDPEGKKWELVSSGYRNEYDFAFDGNGEMFVYDADMEWDMGSPWYRPTRFCHSPSGSEFGWRSGSGKWATWYPDSLPPVQEIGPGSPTGVVFGTGAKFPAKYQRALFGADFTFGTLYAINLEPQGASFKATKEEFVSGRALPLTDLVVGKDGALYFTIGGRGSQSALYRVVYTGSESTAPAAALPPTDLALQRRKLEAFHGHADPAAVAAAWPQLGNADRFIRFAARIAIEHQPVAEWQDKVFTEANPAARITALVALARCGDKALQAKAIASWLGLDLAKLGVDAQLEALRACELLITRMGQPEPALAAQLIAKIDPLFPSLDLRLNRDTASLLCTLQSPTAPAKIVEQMGKNELIPANHDLDQLIARNGGYGGPIAAMLAAKPQQQRIWYAYALSVAKAGWSSDLFRRYYTWFEVAENESKGGNSYKGFIREIRKMAWENVPEAERAELAPEKLRVGLAAKPAAAPLVQPKGPGRKWTTDELTALAQKGLKGRSFEDGRNMFAACGCTTCHRFANEGGSVGPDLSSAAAKFSPHDLLESIVEPSKVISDQYAAFAVTTKDGNATVGRLMGDDGKDLFVAVNPLDPSVLTALPKADVVSTKMMKTSIMPVGLLDRLSQDEVLDLVAYLLSSANPQDAMFKP
jgi:putative heme-binding domain-containing protein